MMERLICEGCPIKEKIALYQKAAADRALAINLAKMQQIGEDGLAAHFNRSAATLLLGCENQILCTKYNRL